VPEEVSASGDTIELHFPTEWLDHHPMTRVDLDEEQALLAAARIRLKVR
jgi:exopolyphosphatase/guanosine-5'-triphosphate,3'-diphosphate pyrophosphatase